MIEVELTKPITAHGEEIDILKMREPIVGDILEVEKLKDAGEIAMIAKMVERTAKIPASSVKNMAPVDLKNAWLVLAPFLDSLTE